MSCRTLRRRAATIVALAATLSIVASARAADRKPFAVGYNAWIGYLALFVAQEKGWFAEEGLDLKTKMFSAPGDGLPPLLAGDLDAHLTTADSVIVTLDKAPGQLVNIYLTDTSAGADAILAKNEIEDVKDLKGKKVAATLGQCNHFLLMKALEQAGLGEKDVELVNMNPDDAGAAFAAGKLDAAVTWEPWITKISGEKLGHVIYSSKEIPNLLLDTVAIRTDTKKSEEVKAFLRALNRGNEFVIANPKEASEIGAKALEQKPAEVADMLPKVKLYGLAQNRAEIGTKDKPGPAVEAAAALAKFFKEQKVNDAVVDASTVFTPAYLP